MSAEIPPAVNIGGYTLQERIGRGTYAVVHKAISKCVSPNGVREVVAVKCVLKQRICSTQTAQDNLVREIELLKKLQHAHIVQLKDFQWDKSYIYIITEYCNGGDLSNFIRKRRCLPERVARRFLQQLADAMKYLRARNVSHMDLKPQNILISSSMSSPNQSILKLADFGFAQYLHPTSRSGSLRGSPLYMAPEMFRKDCRYDARVDLWSIGVILYECVFGKAPFACSSMDELLDQIRSDAVIEIPDRPVISESCRDLLIGLLQRDPSKRMTFEQFFTHPFVDLEHAPTSDSLTKASEIIKYAVRADEEGRISEAVRYYCKALEYFVPAMQYLDDAESRNALRSRILQYVRRAELLKTSLRPNKFGEPRETASDFIDGSSVDEEQFSLSEEDEQLRQLRLTFSEISEVQAAVTVVSAAESLDVSERYEEALEKYRLAIDTMLKVMAAEPIGSQRRVLLRQQVEKWLSRAEQLQLYVDVKKLNLSNLKEEAAQDVVTDNLQSPREKYCFLQ